VKISCFLAQTKQGIEVSKLKGMINLLRKYHVVKSTMYQLFDNLRLKWYQSWQVGERGAVKKQGPNLMLQRKKLTPKLP